MITAKRVTVKSLNDRAIVLAKRRKRLIDAHLASNSPMYCHRSAMLIQEVDRQMGLLKDLYDRVRREETRTRMQYRAIQRELSAMGITMQSTNIDE